MSNTLLAGAWKVCTVHWFLHAGPIRFITRTRTLPGFLNSDSRVKSKAPAGPCCWMSSSFSFLTLIMRLLVILLARPGPARHVLEPGRLIPFLYFFQYPECGRSDFSFFFFFFSIPTFSLTDSKIKIHASEHIHVEHCNVKIVVLVNGGKKKTNY